MATQNSVPSEFTGMTTAIGGNNVWSPNGGSRLLLVDTTNSNKYKYFNCTQQQIIKFSTNLSALDCGIIAAFYMVAFDQIGSVSGTLYNDAQGIGFIDNNSSPLNKQIGRSEIDLLETSGKSAQTTVHGYSDTQQSPPDKWHSINRNGKISYIDQNGIWNNANVNMSNGTFSKNWLNKIDLTKPIDVICTITPTPVDTTNTNYYIKVVTEIHQGADKQPKITLTVDSQKPNTDAGQPKQTYFPASELNKMCFIYSLWTNKDMKFTKWLDGTIDTDAYGIRGNCKAVTNTDNHMFVNFIYNLTWQGIKDTELNNYGWTLDYQYRGVDKSTVDSPFQNVQYAPDNNREESSIAHWVGRYNYSYQNCQVKPTFKPTLLDPNILRNITPTTGSSTDYTICTDNLFPKNTNVMNQYTSDSSSLLKCSYRSAEDSCNVIKTYLVSYDGPGPGPSPGPGSKSNNNNKTLAYVSLSMSIVTIILLILMIIMKL